MTKKQLEVENNFLKLQLKIIADLIKDFHHKSDIEQIEITGAIRYYTEHYQECADYIMDNDLPYNFYNKTMSIF